MDAVHRTDINSFLDGCLGLTSGIIYFCQIIVRHPKDTGCSVYTQMTANTGILDYIRSPCHDVYSVLVGTGILLGNCLTCPEILTGSILLSPD
jgi:hypothetical protein